MAKFAITCPVCGKYAEGRTGFFARKKIECSCGNVIDVKTDKLAARQCPHCGNEIVFDQSKGAAARCPVCHETVNTLADQQNVHIFSCRKCGIRLTTASSATTFVCPVCDYENDVQERLASEKIRKDGLASIIKYEGDNSTFIWKHPIEDFNYGSQLIVHESQEAIFFKDGQALDLFGPGRYTLETQQLPLMEKAYHLPTDTESTFHSVVYFINKTVQMGVKWGTPEKVRFIDPLTGTPLQLGVSGEINMQVSNSRKLLVKLVGTMQGIAWDSEASPSTIVCEKCGQALYTVNARNNTLICDNCHHTNIVKNNSGLTKSIQAAFRPLITSAVKVNLPTVINKEAIDILEIDSKLDMISASLKEAILPGFEEYGLTIPQFFVTGVVLPEDDPNFKRVRELHTITLQTRIYQAEATVKAAKAQSETLYRTAEEQSKAAIEAAHREAELQRQQTETEIARREAERKIIEAQAQAQAQRMAGFTEAEIMRAKGYSQKDVLQTEVQKAYAEGIGNMGPVVGGNGGGSIVGDMLGLGVGMAAASAIAPQLGDMMQNMSLQKQQPAVQKPETWDCSCGQKDNTGNFCSNCGTRRTVLKRGWDCSCGQKGNTGNFCSNCGAPKTEEQPLTWDCSCGNTGITSKFCSNCGKKKGE